MSGNFDLDQYEIRVAHIRRNAPPAVLYEDAIKHEGARITSSGALAASSGSKTGRSPKDKRITEEPGTQADIWWGDVNLPLPPQSFLINRQRARDFFNMRERIYVFDGFAGWDPRYRLKIRVLCASAYHALFMHNMLIRPSEDELANFGEPDYVIYNAGAFPANPFTPRVDSNTCVCLNFDSREFVILGTQYAGEMKKGVFTIMHYLMPKQGVLSMHCSANEGEAGDVTLLFGLSGTGKTTLSADPRRKLIGDDEHCWSDNGVFNIEGGCYAKVAGLSAEKEPEIFDAIRSGSILENVTYNIETREVDYNNTTITENTRCSYPIEFIPNAKLPCVGGHPQNILLLACDAFGVLPPVSLLTPEQAMYHFISGYTAKVAGTEMGVTEPQATFSACFGAAFLVWHPTKYAELLAEKIRTHNTRVWMVNTGWTGGGFGTGERIKLKYTRAIIDAIHDGTLAKAATVEHPVFGFAVPKECPGVPSELLQPRDAWQDKAAYDAAAQKLAQLFSDNFVKYADVASEAIRSAGPKVSK